MQADSVFNASCMQSADKKQAIGRWVHAMTLVQLVNTVELRQYTAVMPDSSMNADLSFRYSIAYYSQKYVRVFSQRT